MAAQFRSYVWDPALIVAQMVLLQAAYYSSLGLWLALLGALGSTGPSLHQIFSDEVRVRAVGLAPRQALSVCPCVRVSASRRAAALGQAGPCGALCGWPEAESAPSGCVSPVSDGTWLCGRDPVRRQPLHPPLIAGQSD